MMGAELCFPACCPAAGIMGFEIPIFRSLQLSANKNFLNC